MVGAAKFAEAVLRLERNHKEFAIRPISSTVPQFHRFVVVRKGALPESHQIILALGVGTTGVWWSRYPACPKIRYGFLRGHTRVKDWAPSFDRSWHVRNDILFLSHAYVLLIGPSRLLRYGNPRIFVARFFLFPENRSNATSWSNNNLI